MKSRPINSAVLVVDPGLSGGRAKKHDIYKAPQPVAIFFMSSFNRDRGHGSLHS